jgi:hypothetical protein
MSEVPVEIRETIAFLNRRIKELEAENDGLRQVLDGRFEYFRRDLAPIQRGRRLVAEVLIPAILQSPSRSLTLEEIRSLVKRKTPYQTDTTINRIVEWLADERVTNPPVLLRLGGKEASYTLYAEGPRI